MYALLYTWKQVKQSSPLNKNNLSENTKCQNYQ